MKKEILKRNKGITLIALVITIVILIILATISINAVLGENGLIKRAEKAGEYQANAKASDSETLDIFDKYIANAIGGNSGSIGEETIPETGVTGIKISYSYNQAPIEGDLLVKLQFELEGNVETYEEYAAKITIEEAESDFLTATGSGYETIDELILSIWGNGYTKEEFIEMLDGDESKYEEVMLEYRRMLLGVEDDAQYEEEMKKLSYDINNMVTVNLSNGQTLSAVYSQSYTTEFTVLENDTYTAVATVSNGAKGETKITINNIDPTLNANITEWDLTKVDAVISEDNKYVPVPKGYVASTIDGEKSVSTGFVIKEGTDGSAISGINEFVWVPVPNIEMLYDEANNVGQLWDFNGTTSTRKQYPTTQNSDYREPDVVTNASEGSDSASGSSYDAKSSKLQQAGLSSTATASDFKTQLQNEFNEMVESVEKYGGFYIGRYETGNLSQEQAVVQKGNTDIASQTWYTMYKVSKEIKANENVVTSMIWGSQWDATLRWMQNYGTSEKVKNFPTNSDGYGNYVGTQGDTNQVIPTGSNSTYVMNNIYDMAGNVFDWTLEAFNINYRTARGGYDLNVGSSTSASIRSGISPLNSNSPYGSRSTLYIAI